MVTETESTVPARARKALKDHAMSAVQLEAKGVETAEIAWREHTFTVPADPEDWEVETTLAFEEGKAASGVRSMLGAAQWAELMEDKPRNRDLGNLFEVIAKTLGLGGQGE